MKNTMNNISIPEPLKQSEQKFKDAIDEHIESNGINAEPEVIHHPIDLPEPKKMEGVYDMNSRTELKQRTTLNESVNKIGNKEVTFSQLEKDIIEQRKGINLLSVRQILKKNGVKYWDYSKVLTELHEKKIIDKTKKYPIKFGRPKK
jgi:hypothetical protein